MAGKETNKMEDVKKKRRQNKTLRRAGVVRHGWDMVWHCCMTDCTEKTEPIKQLLLCLAAYTLLYAACILWQAGGQWRKEKEGKEKQK